MNECSLGGSDEKTQNTFADNRMPAHIQDSHEVLKKPILINEFGLNSRTVVGYSLERRNAYFERLYNLIYSSASNGGPCAGAWRAFLAVNAPRI